jgi:hypothetical protein
MGCWMLEINAYKVESVRFSVNGIRLKAQGARFRVENPDHCRILDAGNEQV